MNLERERVVMLASGVMPTGAFYWNYLAVIPNRYDDFMQAMSSGEFQPEFFEAQGYGEIVASGEGDFPPEAITEKVAKMFGISPADLLGGDEA